MKNKMVYSLLIVLTIPYYEDQFYSIVDLMSRMVRGSSQEYKLIIPGAEN